MMTHGLHFREKWQASSEEEREDIGAMLVRISSFWNGHH
jgi:hypothetical protein